MERIPDENVADLLKSRLPAWTLERVYLARTYETGDWTRTTLLAGAIALLGEKAFRALYDQAAEVKRIIGGFMKYLGGSSRARRPRAPEARRSESRRFFATLRCLGRETGRQSRRFRSGVESAAECRSGRPGR